MPRSPLQTFENNFIQGLKTEYTGLNFPENAATETENCIYERTGRVRRRKGIDKEDQGVYNTINRTSSAVTSYPWLNASGDGFTNLLVMQVGSTLYFFESSNPGLTLSQNKLATTVNLNTYKPSDLPATTNIALEECQYAQGNGYLFVFHPHVQPLYCSYDPSAKTVAATAIDIQIRDFGGIAEGVPKAQRPTSLTNQHRYNLANQGWSSSFKMTSTTSITIGTGVKTFTTNVDASTVPINVGTYLKIYSSANHANFMVGAVTSFTTTTLVMNITSIGGAGTLTDWNIVAYPDNIGTWNDALANFPSNSDIWWEYQNASGVFSPSTTFANVTLQNAPAPLGHFISSAFNFDRNLVSGLTGLTVDTTVGERPATGAFFQNRVFYAGVNTIPLHSSIFFTMTVTSPADFSECYQQNDPTDQNFFDLLPTDGGVITIQGAGTILKLFATKSSLVVFATNGIWAVSGSGPEGLGFKANDYTIVKLSAIKTLSATSFVEVQGTVTWWNIEGIYALNPTGDQGSQSVQINSLSNLTIAGFYNTIPNLCKASARGYYDPINFIVRWVFRSTEHSTIEEKYEYDSVLNLNTLTNAFYPWSVADSPLKINGIVLVDSIGGQVLTNNVMRSTDNVVDGSSNQVIVYQIRSNLTPIFKFIISKPVGATYSMSFGEEYRNEYKDWVSNDGVGVDYVSDLTTGYSVHSEGNKYFNLNYLVVYSDSLLDSGYTVQGIWDFANTGNSGQYSTIQTATVPGTNYNFRRNRFRIRGRGMALQLKIKSISGLPFSLVGWSKYETRNVVP